jgi:signal transduction histidine kinase
MLQLIQTLWDQVRADLGANALPQLRDACQALLSGSLGPLSEHQREDLESIQQALSKLAKRFADAPIDWADYGHAAHALRGPLNSITGFSRLLLQGLDGPLTQAQAEALETIYNVSRQMLAIFNLLLDAVLLNSKELSFQIEMVRAGEVLDELIAVGQTLAANRDFGFETDVNAAVADTTLPGDVKRLLQALAALLAVSAKYGGTGALTLRAWTGETGLLIRLENQACRLPAPLPADLSRLLTDAADPALPYDAHLRLGLAWRLLAEMGGRLEAEQTHATCTFTVTLPTA